MNPWRFSSLRLSTAKITDDPSPLGISTGLSRGFKGIESNVSYPLVAIAPYVAFTDSDGIRYVNYNAPQSDLFGFVAAISSQAGTFFGREEYGKGAVMVVLGMVVGTGDFVLNPLNELGAASRLAKGEVIVANRVAGLTAEARAAQDLITEGNVILGSHVGARTPGGLRVIDHLIQTPSGQILAIEVKSRGAVRNASQILKDSLMSTEGAVLIGKNAPDALRGTRQVIQTIER